MKRTKRTLAIMAFTTLIGCSALVPTAQTPDETAVLSLYTTHVTAPLTRSLTSTYQQAHPDVQFTVQSGSYEEFLQDLTHGEISYFVSSHLPPGDTLWAAPIAQDGIIVIVHPENPVRDLTIDQVRRIYRGLSTNWVEFGGKHLPIETFSREDGSSTRAEFERLVMGQRRTTPNARIVPSGQAAILSVQRTPGGIAYIAFSERTDRIQPLAIDGVLPGQQNIFDSIYPLRSTVFVIGLQEPTAHYRAFIGWAQGIEGQSVVAERYVPLPR